VEYLQNMGVGASLALSIVHQGELWGMIVCHHRTCRKIAPELRAVCDLLSQHISLLIGMAVQGDAEVERTEKSTILSAIGEALSTIGKGPAAPGSIEAAIASQDLLTLLKADGAFIRIGEIAQLIGRTPPLAEAEAMLSTLHPSQPGGTLFTDHLSDVAPDFASLSGTASGVFLMQLVEPSEGILWFRGEVARTVDWAGKPDDAKQSFEGAYRLSPRKSFALWKEIQAGHSLPWRPSETEGALVLQRLLCKALLERTEKEILRLRHQVSIVESRQQAAALQTQIEKEEVVKVRQQETIDLATTYKQLKSIMDSTSDGVLEVSYDWMILYGNLKAMQALPDFRLGKSFWECLPAVLSTPFETSLRIAMEERREMHFEHFYGPYKAWHRVSVFPADEGISIFFRDVTAEKAMEDQLNLEQLLREKRIEALSYMAGGLAHEISNPLAIIHALAGDLQALAAGGSPLTAVEVEKTCGDIVRTADRAMRILRGLRGFAREARQDPMGLASIAEILDECMHLQEARFERHQVEIEIMIQPDCPLLLCREVQIGQILTNLLNNAFDAVVQSNATERWVSLAILWHDDAMTIDITDSGPGVEDHFRAHLMEPFFTTKELGLGMGVGLSLSRTIAQDHGGTLTLCDNTEHTCFRLTLPAPTGVALQAAAANMMEEAL
jgi:light-regulated signal transduction histidine kinase (bacteriophytochrome)